MRSKNIQFPKEIIHHVFRNLIVQSITIQKLDKSHPKLISNMKRLRDEMHNDFVNDFFEFYTCYKLDSERKKTLISSLFKNNRFIDHAFNYFETGALGISEDILKSHALTLEQVVNIIKYREPEFLENVSRISKHLEIENFLADTTREYYISDLLIDLPIDQLVYDYIYFQLLIEKYQYSADGEYQAELSNPIDIAKMFRPLNHYLRFFSPKFTTSFVEYKEVKKGPLRYDYLSYNLRIDEPTENIADSMTTFFLQYIAHRVWFYHDVADVDNGQKGIKIEELHEISKILQTLDLRSNVEHNYEKNISVQTDLVALWLYEINKEKKANKRNEICRREFAKLENLNPEERPDKAKFFNTVDLLLQQEKTDMKPLAFLQEISERLKKINALSRYDLDIKFSVTDRLLKPENKTETKVLLCSAYTPVSGNSERTKCVEYMILNTTISSQYKDLLQNMEK
ncbi:hypothetical protein L292_2034 [Acinetobacter junii CIP 107470 = MTCC 11364]|uniref:Uncharacterized protein n=2 Tax=Acinetobacter TaxID=469 RepID=S7WXZ8_ACIJU|nr:hypothetical protein L292_2034 [Acinetobacter junii CIP 107470 = MTCC 11364]